MPKLWNETIEGHRRAVRDATLDAAAALVAARGLRAVTMSQIAEETGIGRATLYKYFPDVESILMAWHERHVAAHLEHLRELGQGPGTAGERLAAVLGAYARILRARKGHELGALLHRHDQGHGAEERLAEFVCGLLTEGVAAGEVRGDVPAGELAAYCLHALAAAGPASSEEEVDRLVSVTMAGLAVR